MRYFHTLLLLALLSASAAQSADTNVSENDLQRLQAGEIIARDMNSSKAGGSARMQIFVHGSARAIWDVIISCEKAFVFVDGLQLCEVLEDTGDRAVVHQVVKKGFPIPTQDFMFESLRDHYSEIEFRLLEGNLKAMEGAWRFDESPGGTLVDYSVTVQPGVPAPRFIVRRNVQKGMPDLLACVRGLAAGSPTPAQLERDLARCPGDPDQTAGN
jgi:ribosome-associated toxin RatA of RatAB toxin-antitoxin module